MDNPMESILRQLMLQAGPRGATFAGRVIPQGSNQSLRDVMATPPSNPVEGGGADVLIGGGTVIPYARFLAKKAAREAGKGTVGQATKEIEAALAQRLADPRPVGWQWLDKFYPYGRPIK